MHTHSHRTNKHRTRAVLAAGGVAAAFAVAACGSAKTSAPSASNTGSGAANSTTATTSSASASAGSSKCSASATPVTFWGWVPGFQTVVNDFNRTHPSICVTLQNEGSGPTEYNKLLLDIRTGKGLPDAAEVEYSALPEFEVTGALANLDQYGATKLKSDYSSGFWSLVSHGNATYAIPGDAGPMGLFVNESFMKNYGLKTPTTWAQLATEAEQLHKAHPGVELTNFTPVDTELYVGLMWQAGARPFSWSGKSVTYDYNSPAGEKVANYWQKLIDDHAVATQALGPAEFKEMNANKIGIAIFPAWGPSYFAATASKATLGKWRSAELPQWKAGEDVTGNDGGSSYVVMKSSPHAAAAATFVEWMNGTMASWKHLIQAPSSLFPAYLPMLKSPLLKKTTIATAGSSHYFVPFAEAAAHIGPGFSWSPFEIYGTTQMDDVMQQVVAGKTTIVNAFAGLQKTMDTYAKQEGFTTK
jgi:multiple sugar transport system substrate-binding protein